MESMIGMGLLIGLGVVGLKLSQSMQKQSTGIRKMSAITKVMIQMRTMSSNTEVCTANFGGKGIGDTIEVMKGKDDKKMMEAGSKMENGTLMLKEMKVENLMPERKRAQVSFLFERLDKSGQAAHSKKMMNIMADIQGGKIKECLDFGGMLDDSIVNKLCWDADPENFNGGPEDNFDCADNVAHLVAEVKSIYCKENGLFGDPATGACRPVDANLSCPNGTYLRGFLPDGSKDCYAPEPPDPVQPNPSPNCWEAPTAAAQCTVAGPCGAGDPPQSGECDIAGTWTATTLTCKPSSANCSIFKSKVASSLCWQAPTADAVCETAGTCSTLNATDQVKCKNSSGVWQANTTITCKDASTGSCANPGSPVCYWTETSFVSKSDHDVECPSGLVKTPNPTCPTGSYPWEGQKGDSPGATCHMCHQWWDRDYECKECQVTSWSGNKQPTDVCKGESVTETNNCGGSRVIDGTKTDGTCAPSGGCRVAHPMVWTVNAPSGSLTCAEFPSPPRPFEYENVSNGHTGSGNATYCIGSLSGSCTGTINWICRDGRVETTSSVCREGVEQ